MNMKKTLAGVMAGAMAVSAMATVVSADQDAISLTYDLKTYVKDNNKTKAKVTVVANYEGSLVKADSMKKGYITFGADNSFVRGGKVYNDKGVVIGEMALDKNDKTKADGTGMKEFEFTARPYKDVVNNLEEKYQTFKATSYADNVDGAIYDKKNLEKSYYNMPIATGKDVNGAFDLSKYEMASLGYSTEEAAAAVGFKGEIDSYKKAGEGFDKGVYAVRDAVAKMTYEIPNTVSLNKANGWGWGGTWDNANQYNEFTEEQMELFFKNFFGSSLYGDVTMSAENFAKGFWDANKSKKGVISNDTTLLSTPTTVAVGAFTAGAAEEAVWPFKTTLKPGLKTDAIKTGYVKATNNDENNVLAALSSRKAGGNYYTKPVAVINDAIANHDNVVFTFTSYNGYVGTAKSHIVNQWVNVDQGYDYKTSDYDWHNPTFGQHLYTNLADAYSLFDSNEYDQYGSYSSAWGINLFTGAVVVNSGLTMQLSDTDIFNWGNNTLSFDWFDIIDEGKITDAKTFLTSMLLYTPTDWYWDTLTVVVSDDEDEAIDAGEGLDGEGDVIDDEEPAEDVVEEDPTEDVVEEPAETDAAPVETAPSPATGNAPVALAVIPVALAAAAVVAKKRG
ncbi:MAG: hypothetical protein SOT68_03805 [Oscillospiraceae bacterium]|nr:hypothetical protein [Oscillospiraceae bacterium]MDY2863304.1 hypothetical protein [Oscillospiraceae bacterium]